MSEARIIDTIKVHESGFYKIFDIGRGCGGRGREREREAKSFSKSKLKVFIVMVLFMSGLFIEDNLKERQGARGKRERSLFVVLYLLDFQP